MTVGEALLQEAAIAGLDAPSQQTFKAIKASISAEKIFPDNVYSSYRDIQDWYR